MVTRELAHDNGTSRHGTQQQEKLVQQAERGDPFALRLEVEHGHLECLAQQRDVIPREGNKHRSAVDKPALWSNICVHAAKLIGSDRPDPLSLRHK